MNRMETGLDRIGKVGIDMGRDRVGRNILEEDRIGWDNLGLERKDLYP